MPRFLKLNLRHLWFALFAAMIALGILRRPTVGIGHAPRHLAPDASAEALFASSLGESDMPARLGAALEKLPPGRPVLLLYDAAQSGALVPKTLVQYTAWPRQIVPRELRLNDSAAALQQVREHFCAVIFLGQRPPAAFPSGQRFGNGLILVPLGS